jgi:hypothetical protein
LNDIGLDIFLGGGSINLLRGSDFEDIKFDIRDIRCKPSKRRRLCAFDLVRLGDLKHDSDKDTPEALRCTARLIYVSTYEEVGWSIDRLPPRKRRGHTRSSIQCTAI